MKRKEVWNPAEIQSKGETFKVGDLIYLSRESEKDYFVSGEGFEKGVIITGFVKRHDNGLYGPFFEHCFCKCHFGSNGKEGPVDEPCEKCNIEAFDQGYIVKYEIPAKEKMIHVSRVTKKKPIK